MESHNLIVAAVHEAGHCVVALRNGLIVNNVYIGEKDGYTEVAQLKKYQEPKEVKLNPPPKPSALEIITSAITSTFEPISITISTKCQDSLRDSLSADKFRCESDIIEVYLGGWVAEQVFYHYSGRIKGLIGKLRSTFLSPEERSLYLRIHERESISDKIETVMRAKRDLEGLCDITNFPRDQQDGFIFGVMRKMISDSLLFRDIDMKLLWLSCFPYKSYDQDRYVPNELIDETLWLEQWLKGYFSNQRVYTMLINLAREIKEKRSLSGSEIKNNLEKTKNSLRFRLTPSRL